MEITYIGHSCFKIKGKELTLVVDPYDPKTVHKLPKLECDVLLTTHEHSDHNNKTGVSGYRLLINGAGEYETSGVFIHGLPIFHDDKEGKERGKSLMYLIEIDGICVLHLGDLGHELSKETLEKIGSVDVLMIPVGGKYTIGAETAVEVISEIEPGYVLPMHYKTPDSVMQDLAGLDEFLDEMGVKNSVRREEKLKISSKADIPDETQVVILNPAH